MTRAAPFSRRLSPNPATGRQRRDSARKRSPIFIATASAAILLGSGLPARAEESTVSQPGDHPDYVVELEPEAIVLFGQPIDDGPGVGVRASIPFMKNGFIPTINNVPAITFGLSRSPIGDGRAPFYSPVALQWNFWLSPHWSVMGEAGAFLVFGDGTRAQLQPALMGGGRFHVTDRVAITARISLPNTPSLGVGVSLLL